MTFPQALLHKHFKDKSYASLISLATLIAASIVVTLANNVYYVLSSEMNLFHVTINSVFMAYCISLLFFLFYTRSPVVTCYLFSAYFIIHISFAIMHGSPTARMANIVWYSIIPVYLTFHRLWFMPILSTGLTIIVTLKLLRYMFDNQFITQEELAAFQPLAVASSLLGMGMGFSLYYFLGLYEKNHRHSIYDHLTGLYNRHILELSVNYLFQNYKRKGVDYYILFTDLDRFKEVNDLFGHGTGDQVLRLLGKRLNIFHQQFNQTQQGEMDVYRFGGDEFLFTIIPNDSNWKPDQTVQEITQLIETPYPIEFQQIEVDVSVGVIRSNEAATSSQELILFADSAMYASKHAKKLNYSPSNKTFQHWQKKFAIYKGLQHAIINSELSLVYQPIYQSQSLSPIGCEALLRWNSGVAGKISPNEFIPVAESTGMIQDISLWVLDTVSKDAVPWIKAQPDFTLAINLSPYLFKNTRFIKKLESKIKSSHHFKNLLNNIEFEITETASITNSPYTAEALQNIRAMGFRLALDDYGQGRTSFLDLKQAAFHTIKLDKALIWDAADNPSTINVVRAAIHSAHSLKLQVTAEGIETKTHLQLATNLGCDVLQGFWFSRPVTADKITTLLQPPPMPS